MSVEYIQYKVKSARYLLPLGMVYITIFISSVVMAHKLVPIGGIVTSVSTFIVPMTYVLADTIAEIYGPGPAKQLIWWTLGCEFIFALICQGLLLLPSPEFLHNQAAYDHILGVLFRIFLGSTVGILVGSFVNVYFILKWKFKFQGRFFWLRSVGSSTIGELLFTVITVFIVFIGTMPFYRVVQLAYTSYIFKLLISPIDSGIAALLVLFLKNREKFSKSDSNNEVNFNPFKLSD